MRLRREKKAVPRQIPQINLELLILSINSSFVLLFYPSLLKDNKAVNDLKNNRCGEVHWAVPCLQREETGLQVSCEARLGPGPVGPPSANSGDRDWGCPGAGDRSAGL